ncbi:Fe-S cluster assembly protein SufD [Paenibacillus sepulcri]|uniref:Fe-S cluster assembly protein SufD n=1 Tax=Paenibacillus sepulcri TaxID=359917 RepID=A0ABS7BW42_9BACL|nr:Fe-S cluster assembly protein SufD [Paenibacillus sepulcri]
MKTSVVLPTTSNAAAELSRNRGEPSWMTDLRLCALELAGELELPELEKTRIDRWSLDSYGLYHTPELLDNYNDLPEKVKELIGGNPNSNPVMVHRDSGLLWKNQTGTLEEQGVIFTDMETALREHEALVHTHFMSVVKADEDRLTALHAALWSGGVFLYVPRNVEVTVPLQAIFQSEHSDATFAPHILIIAEDNSSVVYVDHYVSGRNNNAVHNGVVEVVVKPGARVHVASVHNLSGETTALIYRRAMLDNDAIMQWTIGELNAGNTMSDTSSILKGNGSRSDAKVISIGTGAQKLNLTTRAIHYGRNTPSDMLVKAVVQDEATAIINGYTRIEKGASGADAGQTERLLMLSDLARGDANPILLIDENDVYAGHGASIGKIDAEQIYYMMSRGVTRRDSERLIILGFLLSIIQEIPLKHIEEQLYDWIERKLRN